MQSKLLDGVARDVEERYDQIRIRISAHRQIFLLGSGNELFCCLVFTAHPPPFALLLKAAIVNFLFFFVDFTFLI
jgi:hypothetical protein